MTIRKQPTLGKNLFLIALITVGTIFLWIGLDIVRVSKKTTIPQPTQVQMKPLDSRIDPTIFTLVEDKIAPSKEELASLLKSQPATTPNATDSSKISTKSGSLDINKEE